MSSRIPARPFSTPSPLQRLPSEAGTPSERGTTERGSAQRSSGPTPPKYKTEGDIEPAEKVKVYARIRPALRDDETPGALAWSEDGQLTIFRPDAPVPQSDFVFDKVLGPDCSQADVYTAAVSDVVGDVLRGYNGTILAYGQTGAGKTFTLGNTAPDAIGMIPRAAAELFAAAARDHLHTYRITMSYIQIYMEMIQDLLNPTADNLPIREDSSGVFVAGACEVPVSSLEECLHYLELGEQNRIFAFTHLNAHSSRSHAVVMLTAVKGRKYLTTEERAQAEAPDQDGVVAQKVTVGKLYLVDLAGSERLKKSKSVGLRATEARSINLSLTMLGMCISARAQDSPHVPFRDSKLTRLLQESLGGNARTSLILCLSDVRQHADESLQSLQFGARAACVRNKPVVNERVHVRQLTAELLAALEEGHERADGLEAALSQTKEERDALQAALAREKARSAAIVDALRSEAESRQAQAAARLAEQAELLSTHVQQLGQVQQQQGQLELEVARLRDEQRAREEAHRAELAALQERLAAAQAAAASERAALEAEARSQQVLLAAAAQRQAAALVARLTQERTAAREHATSIHLALARLQQALGALAAGPAAPPEPSTAEEAAPCGEAAPRCGAEEAEEAGRCSEAPRPAGEEGCSSAAPHRPGMMLAAGGGEGGAVQLLVQAALERDPVPAVGGKGGGQEGGGGGEGPGSPGVATSAGPGASGAGSNLAALASGAYVPATALHAGLAAVPDRTPSSHPVAAGQAATTTGQASEGRQDGSSRPVPYTSTPATIQSSMDLSDLNAALAAAEEDLLADLGAVQDLSTPGSADVGGIRLRPVTTPAAATDAAAATTAGGPPTATPPSDVIAPSPMLSTPPRSPPAAARVPPSGAASSASGAGSYAAAHAAAVAAGVSTPPWRQSPGYGQLHGGAAAAAQDGGAGGGSSSGLTPPPPKLASTTPQLSLRKCNSVSSSATAASSAPVLAAPPPLTARGSGGSDPQALRPSSAPSHALGAVPLAALPPQPSSSGQQLTDAPSDSISMMLPATRVTPLSAAATPSPSSTQQQLMVSAAASAAACSLSSAFQQGYPTSPTTFATAAGDSATPASPAAAPVAGRTTHSPAFSTACGSGLSSSAPAAVGFPGALFPLQHSHTYPGHLSLNPAFDAIDSEGFTMSEDVVVMGGASSAAAFAATAPEASTAASPCLTPAAAGAAGAVPRWTAPLLPPSSAAAAGGAVSGPSLFAGIHVQLNAMWDLVCAARRVKAGLEARAMQQAGELARLREEQRRAQEGAQEMQGQLQATQDALAAAESRLSDTTSQLEAARRTLDDTLQALYDTRQQLQERGTALEDVRQRLGETGERLEEAVGLADATARTLEEREQALQASSAEGRRLAEDLAAAMATLAAERDTLRWERAASERCTEVSAQALCARRELQRQIHASNAIKRAFKRYKVAQLRSRVEANERALAEAEASRRAMQAAQSAREADQAAAAGQVLVQESVAVMKDAVGCILAAFLGRRHELAATRALNRRLAQILPSASAAPARTKGSAAAAAAAAAAGTAAARPAAKTGCPGAGSGICAATPSSTRLQGYPAGTHTLSLLLAAATPPPLQLAAAASRAPAQQQQQQQE
ncbi:hypothetical protein Agub_g14466 [Astrephomene gubernaculifera]|uniref:Kinesin motor domain-containing protein n=1 Tax=Astrephomene gubernaculifera TaxID=47775 RepID=A0AAD3E1L5_9CHLO|nr:hypothetical protein Agub_g14466 [Astrephomene gubernaculifera]